MPSTAAARESFRGVLQEVRKQNLLADQSLETVISFLSLSHRLDAIADDLEICRSQALALTIDSGFWWTGSVSASESQTTGVLSVACPQS